MLVLTRKSGESVRIGKDIIVSVLSSSCGSTKLGITAPHKISVHRDEVYKKIEMENRAAVVPDDLRIHMLKDMIIEEK